MVKCFPNKLKEAKNADVSIISKINSNLPLIKMENY